MKRKNRYFEAYTQIIMLVFATIAFSYILHESAIQNEINTGEEKVNELSGVILSLLRVINKIIWDEKTMVSAEESKYTCLQAEDGGTCVEYPASECDANCVEDCIQTEITYAAGCEIGTCYNPLEGTCQAGTPKETCDSNEGVWSDESMQVCQKGCCLNGDSGIFETERACARNAELTGIDENFDSTIRSEDACIRKSLSIEKGACILGSPDAITGKYDCDFGTRESCEDENGDFNPGVLCSNEGLNTICTGEATAKCVNGKDEIYWFDSCGNPENIYDINNARRGEGVILSKQESCTLTDDNRGVCGNCVYPVSVCLPETESEGLIDQTQNVVCRDLSCDENGDGTKDRENGESWCMYQGGIGEKEGRAVDTPGSRSFVKECQEGEITTESCGDYRGLICAENTKNSVIEGHPPITEAKCRPNLALQCFGYSSGGDMTTECAKNEDCFVKNVYVAGGFHFSMCVPKYPKGFDMQDEEEIQDAVDICGIGSRPCTVIYKKGWTGRWKCWKNCDCEKPQFGQQMNDLCMSLGDCGAEVNYEGVLTTGGQSISGHRADALSSAYLGGLSSYSNDFPNQKINLSLIALSSYLGAPGGLDVDIDNAVKQQQFVNIVTTLSGLSSTLFLILELIGPWGWLIWAVLTALFAALGIGKTKDYTISFNCNPWRAPLGGGNCDECDEDRAKGIECSRYACQSLGTACKFIPENEGSSDPSCVASSINDVASPQIRPWFELLSENYTIEEFDSGFELSSNENEDGSIEANTPTNIGISLDRLGSCKYAFLPFDTPIQNFEEDGEYTNEEMESSFTSYDFSNGLLKLNHSATIMIPSATSLGLEDFDKNARADFNMYVRCTNIKGYTSEVDYVIRFWAKPGKDGRAPLITIREPKGEFVKYNSTNQVLNISTNEPANCSWSSSDMEYDSMENKMDCKNDLTEQTGLGWWECNSTLPITENENKFYVRCADQPLEINESNRNKNGQSIPLILKKTSKLEITYAEPNNKTLTFGTSVASIKIGARTSGGLSSGSTCYASLDGQNYYIIFTRKPDKTNHEFVFNSDKPGDKKIWLKCEDGVGNVEFKNITFNVEIDDEAPKITRIYYGSGGLMIKTDERASCALSLEKCSFNFVNGTLMSGSEFTHSFSVEKNKVYYVKCKDVFNNGEAGMCTRQFKLTSSITRL